MNVEVEEDIMKEWERQAALLSLHGNRRFVALTPRGLRQPVVQKFDCTASRGRMSDLLVACALVAALLVAAALPW